MASCAAAAALRPDRYRLLGVMPDAGTRFAVAVKLRVAFQKCAIRGLVVFNEKNTQEHVGEERIESAG